MFLVKLEVVIYIIVDGACRALAYVHLLKSLISIPDMNSVQLLCF